MKAGKGAGRSRSPSSDFPPARLKAALSVAIGLALLAGLAGPSNWSWGMNLLAYYPAAWALIWSGLALLAVWLLPETSPKVSARARWMIGRPWPAAFFFGFSAAVIFLLFRVKIFLLGDGYEIIRRLHQGQHPTPRSALFNLFEPVFFQAFRGTGRPQEEMAAGLLSILAGAVAIGFSVFHFARIGRRDFPWALSLSAVFFLNGSVQLFFGYVEAYALLLAFTLVFYAAAADFLTLPSRAPLLAATVALLGALAAHPFGVTLLPGWIYLATVRRGETWGFHGRRLWVGGGLVLGFTLVLAAIFELNSGWRTPGHPLRYLSPQIHWQGLWGGLKNVFHPKPWALQYRVWSLVHLADSWNTLWLVGLPGLAVLGAALTHAAGRRAIQSPLGAFGILCLLGIVLFRAIWRTPLGAMRDWDLFAGFGAGIAGLAAAVLLNPPGRYLSLPVAAAGIYFLVPWLGIQWNVERSARRHIDGVESSPRPEPPVEALFHCAMGDRLASLRQLDLAANAYGRAQAVSPKYEFAWRLAMVQLAAGQPGESIRALESALKLKPDDEPALIELASALAAVGQTRRAAGMLERVREINPRSATALVRLARLDFLEGRIDQGLSRLDAAEKLLPRGHPDHQEIRDSRARWLTPSPSGPETGGSVPGGTPR